MEHFERKREREIVIQTICIQSMNEMLGFRKHDGSLTMYFINAVCGTE